MQTYVESAQYHGNEIAVIGMAGRFPGASDLEAFWQNLCNGVEAVTFFTREELLEAGIPATTLDRPNYVRANVVLENTDLFDASFFGYSPREALLMDPQQRLFLECAWLALEHAGYNAQSYPGLVGVYASMSTSTYLLYNLMRNRQIVDTIAMPELLYGNEKDFLATRVSYKLGLRGPSMAVQTACSSSLVAVHQACQSLLNGECDIALAGGACVHTQPLRGYLYQEEGYFSPDGHCRAFDARAQGMLGGSGLGIVVLKRLSEALNEGDYIHAIIKGTACNNDGSAKMGYTTPSVQGQAAVIKEALTVAQVAPETVGYIEAHGTGTPIGDPLEFTALCQVYGESAVRQGSCAIGSIKTNMGHLDAAAGIAGLLKTILSLEHGYLPAHLHFEAPHPQIDLASSPFYINNTSRVWPRGDGPRRAGVSSFGVGGTNAHILLEEAPAISTLGDGAKTLSAWHLLPLSAQSTTGLRAQQLNLATCLRRHTELRLADVAYTLQIGRRAFSQRSFVVCETTGEALDTLETGTPQRLFSASAPECSSVIFLFPGGGAQYMNMGRALYEHEPVFREHIMYCAHILKPLLGYDILALLYPTAEEEQAAMQRSWHASNLLPVLFAVEYALARLLLSWNIVPQAMVGHSLGEYVAACLAGVFSLEDALALVAVREELTAHLSEGAMLSVLLPEQELLPFMNEDLSLAAVNTPIQCVVSGTSAAIESLERALQASNITYRRLPVTAAGHSALLEPVMGQVAEVLRNIQLQPPSIPFVSNLTGTWITPVEATDYTYWARHLRHTVRFSDCIQEILREPDRVFVEVGPGQTLSQLVKNILVTRRDRDAQASARTQVLTAMRQSQEEISDLQYLLTTAGRLWLAGVPLDWRTLHAHQNRRRVPLPGYPFEGQRYWIEPDRASAPARPEKGPSVAESNDTGLAVSEKVLVVARTTTLSSGATDQRAAIAPRNETEQMIALIWQEVLGAERVGVEDNFFDLGGDSLIGLRLVTRLREAFAFDLPLRAFLENPTIAQLAEVIDLLLIEEIEKLSDEEVNELIGDFTDGESDAAHDVHA
ncbi:MAG TPA: beta-ketoacyl synthase N-terminal-like domain-containing protein [Ktedonobacteraceae bacterium]